MRLVLCGAAPNMLAGLTAMETPTGTRLNRVHRPQLLTALRFVALSILTEKAQQLVFELFPWHHTWHHTKTYHTNRTLRPRIWHKYVYGSSACRQHVPRSANSAGFGWIRIYMESWNIWGGSNRPKNGILRPWPPAPAAAIVAAATT